MPHMFDKLNPFSRRSSKPAGVPVDPADPQGRKAVHDAIKTVGRSPEQWQQEYTSTDMLERAGDAKADKNYELLQCVRSAIDDGIKKGKFPGVRHFPCVPVEPEPNETLRNTEWRSAAKKKVLKVRDMNWTHLINTFGFLYRAIMQAYKKTNNLDTMVHMADPGFLQSLIRDTRFQGLAYEILWRKEFGCKVDKTLCWTHGDFRRKEQIDDEDFFFSYNESE